MQILNSNLLKNEKQIILVYAKNTEATVYMRKKVDNMWITILETKGYCGKNGLGKEKEGDLKTPIGLFDLGIAFGLHKNIKTELDYYFLNKNMYWICDSNSKYYNQFVDLSKKENDIEKRAILKDWKDSEIEHLIDENVAYEYAIEIKYNKKCEQGKGSAIFLHCIKNGPTAGCVSIPAEKMKYILEHIEKDTKIYIDYEDKL